MEMSEADIRLEYKLAKNKVRQIGILADENCCSKDRIKEILGLPQPKKRMTYEQMFDELDKLDETIKELEKQYKEIAGKVLGINGKTYQRKG